MAIQTNVCEYLDSRPLTRKIRAIMKYCTYKKQLIPQCQQTYYGTFFIEANRHNLCTSICSESKAKKKSESAFFTGGGETRLFEQIFLPWAGRQRQTKISWPTQGRRPKSKPTPRRPQKLISSERTELIFARANFIASMKPPATVCHLDTEGRWRVRLFNNSIVLPPSVIYIFCFILQNNILLLQSNLF